MMVMMENDGNDGNDVAHLQLVQAALRDSVPAQLKDPATTVRLGSQDIGVSEGFVGQSISKNSKHPPCWLNHLLPTHPLFTLYKDPIAQVVKSHYDDGMVHGSWNCWQVKPFLNDFLYCHILSILTDSVTLFMQAPNLMYMFEAFWPNSFLRKNLVDSTQTTTT